MCCKMNKPHAVAQTLDHLSSSSKPSADDRYNNNNNNNNTVLIIDRSTVTTSDSIISVYKILKHVFNHNLEWKFGHVWLVPVQYIQ